MVEPKPCPKCGKSVKVGYKMPFSFIGCKKCNIGMVEGDYYEPGDGKEELIKKWNRMIDNGN